jgi:sporulation protein YlmC with PRC-barrel domain
VAEVLIAFDLLDRQVLDRDGAPVGTVDDVELGVDGRGVMYVAALLTGQEALGNRLGGRLGATVAGMARRLKGQPGPTRIDYRHVAKVDSAVHLSVRRDLLPEPPLEAWLRDHLVDRIPGSANGD